MKRRDFLQLAAAASLAACATPARPKARVVVVGGGFGGATAAKYLRLWDPSIEVTLVERETDFVSCPMSNLVLAGFAQMADIRRGYDGLGRLGVRVVRDEAVALDPGRKIVRLARGGEIAFDRAIVSPGVDFDLAAIEGYAAAQQSGALLHAWKAGEQTQALRRQLEALRDGGVFVISVPVAPYRCPPGPYERASLVAAYFKLAKPRAKILVLDANPDLTSKGPLFRRAWADLYPGMIEYRPNSTAVGFDAAARTLRLELEDAQGDVFNVIPPQRAGTIAQQAGLVTTNNRWCDVDWRSMESRAVPGVHVLGDATLSAQLMPKSASMAANHAKIAAAGAVELLNGRAPEPMKILNTCYSFVSRTEAVRVSSVHQWDAAQETLLPVKGAGGLSAARSDAEGGFAWAWARSIWADALS